jgi:hypothetical protein
MMRSVKKIEHWNLLNGSAPVNGEGIDISKLAMNLKRWENSSRKVC